MTAYEELLEFGGERIFDFLKNARLHESQFKYSEFNEVCYKKMYIENNQDSNEGEVVNNMYEKLTVKLPKEMDVPMNVEVKLINPEASIYGEYRNQLSIVAEDVQVVSK